MGLLKSNNNWKDNLMMNIICKGWVGKSDGEVHEACFV